MNVRIFYSVLTFIHRKQEDLAKACEKDCEFIWLIIWLPVNTARVERGRGNKRNERKPACCRGYICWKDLLACRPGAFTPFKDTHSLSHTVTQWTRGHSSTCQSKQREERKYNCASQQTLPSWPAESMTKQTLDLLFTMSKL